MKYSVSILSGALAPLGPKGVPSGIVKTQIEAPVWLGSQGLEGDAQGDLRVHGGPEKALLHYAFDHYEGWRTEVGALPPLEAPGAFGENISSLGLVETTIAAGDIFRLGGARIQVSQLRQPCWKLNTRFGVADMSRRVQTSGRTGWYYRVLEEGLVAPHDELELLDRVAPEWTIARLQRVFYRDTLNREELEAMLALEVLPLNVRDRARKRLESGQVEDWAPRLWGDSDRAS